jgi:hypothetical protein
MTLKNARKQNSHENLAKQKEGEKDFLIRVSCIIYGHEGVPIIAKIAQINLN